MMVRLQRIYKLNKDLPKISEWACEKCLARPEQSLECEKFRVGYIAIFSRKATKSSHPQTHLLPSQLMYMVGLFLLFII